MWMLRVASATSAPTNACAHHLGLEFLPVSVSAAEFTLIPSPQTVHIGHFNAALRPVLTVNSGDTVTIETATQIDPGDEDCTCREAMYYNIDCFVGYRSDAEAKAAGASMYAQVPGQKRNRSRVT